MRGSNIMSFTIGKYIVGIVVILLGIYQLLNSRKYVHEIQKDGSKTTSHFVGYAVWSSFVVGILIIGMGMSILSMR
jgi:hypothetical protein